MRLRQVFRHALFESSCLLVWSFALLAGCSDNAAPANGGPFAGASNVAGGTASAGMSAGGMSAGGMSSGGTGAAGAANVGGAPAGAGVGGATAGTGGSPLAGAAGNGDGCAGTLICDDFESYTTQPAAPWTVSTNQGTVAIDTQRHMSGKQSVKFSTTGVNTYQRAFIGIDGAPFPLANNAFYGRMMIYTTAAANDGVHWTMIQAEGPVAAQGITNATVRYGGQQMKSLMANYDSTGKKSDCWQHSATKMPEGQWACMQWYFDGKTNTQKFWLNGAAVDDLTVTGQGQGCIDHDTNDMWYFPQDFSKAYVGWESYQKDDAREVWIDDVALGTQAIACPIGGVIGTL
ncbi:MAG: hypothetical protein WDO69_00100 [Pseudomonadota bacterium]